MQYKDDLTNIDVLDKLFGESIHRYMYASYWSAINVVVALGTTCIIISYRRSDVVSEGFSFAHQRSDVSRAESYYLLATALSYNPGSGYVILCLH